MAEGPTAWPFRLNLGPVDRTGGPFGGKVSAALKDEAG